MVGVVVLRVGDEDQLLACRSSRRGRGANPDEDARPHVRLAWRWRLPAECRWLPAASTAKQADKHESAARARSWQHCW